jgi:hypothetical protein
MGREPRRYHRLDIAPFASEREDVMPHSYVIRSVPSGFAVGDIGPREAFYPLYVVKDLVAACRIVSWLAGGPPPGNSDGAIKQWFLDNEA